MNQDLSQADDANLPGRSETTPRQSWRTIVMQSLIDVWQNNLMEWAAAIAMYAMLSVFPLLLAAVALASYVVEPSWAARWLTALTDLLLPSDLFSTETIVTAAIAQQRQLTLFGFIAWVFGGRRIIGVLITALNRVSDVDLRHETFKRRLWVEVVMLAGIALLFLTSIIAMPVVTTWWPPVVVLLQLLVLSTGVGAIYAIVPRGRRAWPAVVVGAVVATVLLVLAREVFRRTIGLFWPGFSIAYGPLAIAVALLLWGWIAGMIILIGGSLASHVKVMALEGFDRAEAARRHVTQASDFD